MTTSEPTNVEEIIVALQQLGGKAAAKEIKDKVLENRGSIPPQYRSARSYSETIQRVIENYCPQSANFQGTAYFDRISRGEYRLIAPQTYKVDIPSTTDRSSELIITHASKIAEVDKGTSKGTSVAAISELVEAKGERYSSTGIFDPTSIQDAREKVSAAIARRRGQPQFRKVLLQAYSGKCAITDCDVEEALEAAHIISYKGADTNYPTNGLLLRADIHTLFDIGLITIETSNMTVVLSESLFGTTYSVYHGKKLRLPELESARPNIQALDMHKSNMSIAQ